MEKTHANESEYIECQNGCDTPGLKDHGLCVKRGIAKRYRDRNQYVVIFCV